MHCFLGRQALSRTVLVVDDEPSILRMISLVLQELDCRILTAYNAESALEILDSVTPDLVIADIRLPGIDGVELTRRIKAGVSPAPVLLISAFGEPRDHPGDAFVPKPFDNEDLLEAVRSLTEGPPQYRQSAQVWYGGDWPLAGR